MKNIKYIVLAIFLLSLVALFTVACAKKVDDIENKSVMNEGYNYLSIDNNLEK